ncbi:glycosyltransferase family 2 protein [Pseudactinotalea sp.]|uniref:glycosyltransferase family 2 protein n=1 Tax=Pseudactinotalea sp. TaxID=1926260 RepID=UPI003B3BAF6B
MERPRHGATGTLPTTEPSDRGVVPLSVAAFSESLSPSQAHARQTWTSWQLAARPDTSLDALAHLALRNKSTVALDALAGRAFAGGQSATLLQGIDFSAADLMISDRAAAAALALAWAGMGRDAAWMSAAATLYLRIIDDVGTVRLSAEHQQAAAQALFLSGRFDEAAALIPELRKLPRVVRSYLEADLASPAVATGHATEHWLELLSARQVAQNLEPLQLQDGGNESGDLFDRLDSCASGAASANALVSVVIPCFRPAQGLITALRSLAGQSWLDLEMIVVDDGSGPEFDEWFERARAVDPRVRVIRMSVNAGAYAARNHGLLHSLGSIVTFQDADDWSHPRRVQLQVEKLSEPDVVATRSSAVRARPDLTHQWFGYSPIRLNASSLMMRRDDYDRLGPFLEIRKGADSEYLERIVARGGELANVRESLAVTRLREGSLSRGDFTYQWSSPDRLDFRGSYRAWHRRTEGARRADPELPFSVPTTFSLDLTGGRQFDVIWTADYSEADAELALDVVATSSERLADAGVRQGLWHLESAWLVRDRRPEMHESWRDRIEDTDGLIAVCRTDRVSAGLQVIVDPSVLLTCGDQPTSVAADDVEIWLTPECLAPDESGLPIDLLWVRDQVRRWWSVTPRWVAAPHLDATGREALQATAGSLEIGFTRVPGFAVAMT